MKTEVAEAIAEITRGAEEVLLEKELAEKLESGKPLIVNFTAGWCGPCKKMAPIYEKLVKQNKDLHMRKVDIDNNPLAAAGVRSVPTFKAYKNGKEIESFKGASEEGLTWLINFAKTNQDKTD